MAKFPIYFVKKNDVLKRSVNFEQLDMLLILCTDYSIFVTGKNKGEIRFTFFNGSYYDVATVKCPLYVLDKIKKQNKKSK